MIYKSWRNFEGEWQWRNFTAEELSCPCCGEFYYDPHSFTMLQHARNHAGKAFVINSAHRCTNHNKAVHGAKNSEHLRIAFDISLAGHDKEELISALFDSGFTTFGMYNSFIHTDRRSYKKWYGTKQSIWQNIYAKIVKVRA